MTTPSEAVELDIVEVHLGIGSGDLSERSLVPGDNPCLDQSIPVFFRPCWCLEEREWRGKAIFLTEDLDMVGPCGGVITRHLVWYAVWMDTLAKAVAQGSYNLKRFNLNIIEEYDKLSLNLKHRYN